MPLALHACTHPWKASCAQPLPHELNIAAHHHQRQGYALSTCCHASRSAHIVQVLTLGRDGKQAFEEVFMFSHRDFKTVASFISLTTASGASIAATPGHYIWAADAADDRNYTCQTRAWVLKRAGDISMGSCLLSADTATTGDMCDEVVARSVKFSKGLYNPHTFSGSIVVDGVAAATFSDVLPPSLGAHAAVTTPFRWLYRACMISDSIRACDALNSHILWPLSHVPEVHTAIGKFWVALIHSASV